MSDEPKPRLDRSYIAPQLTWREKLIAGIYTVLDMVFILGVIGVSIALYNFFSPSYPLREKTINAFILLIVLALVAGLAWLVMRVVLP